MFFNDIPDILLIHSDTYPKRIWWRGYFFLLLRYGMAQYTDLPPLNAGLCEKKAYRNFAL